ncbi:MAG: NAD-dependent epimerase/dehydratase family protein [Motiliproteus sp.]|nr:NAD-dependent epimerase/dehydratase family protein [Motiliproteus sp.]MCW9053457.1 NAD-dependent epimerase/dehydratase family protein [Motiliproteus sp.]
MNILEQDGVNIADSLSDFWHRLDGRTLLITGGSGYIGRSLLHSLAVATENSDLKVEIFIPTRDHSFLERFKHFRLHKNLIAFEWGLGNHLVTSLKSKSDFIIHGAGPVDVSAYRSAPSQMMGEIVGLTENLLEYADKYSPKKLLNLSSGAVYGDFFEVTNGPVKETCSAAPNLENWRSCYGEAKRYCELLIASQNYANASARIFTVMGPNVSLQAPFALASFLNQASQGKNIKLSSDGTARRSFLYESELIEILWRLLLTPELKGPYNVGAGEAVSIARLANSIAKHFPESKVILGAASDDQRNYYIPDLNRLNEFYVPNIRFSEGLARTIQAMRQQGVLSS